MPEESINDIVAHAKIAYNEAKGNFHAGFYISMEIPPYYFYHQSEVIPFVEGFCDAGDNVRIVENGLNPFDCCYLQIEQKPKTSN